MTFAELKADLLASIGRAPSALAYKMTTSDINSTLRIVEMHKSAALTTDLTLPTDYLEAVSVYGVRELVQSPMTTLGDGVKAGEYAVFNGALVAELPVTLKYFAAFDDLSADADTNAVLSTYPDIYVYGVLAHHAALLRDPEALAVHFPAFERAMKKAQRADNMKHNGGHGILPTVVNAP